MHNSDIERLASEALSYIDRCEYDGLDGRAVLPQADLPGLTRIIGKLLTLRPDPALRVQPANVTDFAVLSAAVGSPDAADVASMAMHGWHVERLADVPAVVAALKRLAGDAAPEQPDLTEKPKLHIDEGTLQAHWGEHRLDINSHTDFVVLHALDAAEGGIVSYIDLLRLLKPDELSDNIHTLDEAPPEVKDAVKHIRQAIRVVSSTVRIDCVRGVGYRLSYPE